MNKEVNDNAFMLIRLRERGAKLAIITGKSLGLKGKGDLPTYENMDGIPIYRLYKDLQDMFLFPNKAIKQILEIAKDLKPDLIFCSQELNIRLALLIQKSIKKPIVLLVEDAGRISSGEELSSLKMKSALFVFGIPSGLKLWSWLCEKSDILITCSPRDQQNLKSLSKFDKPVFYLPWPSHVPADLKVDSVRGKQGIYVGSLYPFKNTQEFEETLPIILEKTQTKRFIVVGTGLHVPIIKNLQIKYGDAIRYIDHLPRNEALKLISESHYAYSPVKLGGWGFIGDCWSVKTPVVMTHNDDNYVVNDKNALVSENYTDLVKKINRLFDDPETFKALQTNGFEEYAQRKAEVVGDKLYAIFNTLSN